MPATTVLASRPAEVLESAEAFKEVDGEYKLAGTLTVFREDDNTYHARSKARYSSPSEVKVEHLTEVGVETNITITSIRFSLAIKFDIYLEPIEKVYILLRI